MNMKKWLEETIASPRKRALPVLSFPSVQLLGITVQQLTTSSDFQAKGMAASAARCPAAASLTMLDLSVEAEAFGAHVVVSEGEVPTVVGSMLVEPEDADNLAVPAVGAGRTGIYVETIPKARALITDRPVLAGIIGPFSLAGRLMGMTELMINCYDEPEMVEATLEKATSFLVEYAKAYKAVGADGVVMAEPAAGLLSPSMMSQFSLPYVKRVLDAVQDDEFAFIYHNCGNATEKMRTELSTLGAMGYHFGDAIDMAVMLDGMPTDALVMGNISPVREFAEGTPESIRAATLALLERCSGYPNFVISSGCDIPPHASWDNIDAFFRAVDEFYDR